MEFEISAYTFNWQLKYCIPTLYNIIWLKYNIAWMKFNIDVKKLNTCSHLHYIIKHNQIVLKSINIRDALLAT